MKLDELLKQKADLDRQIARYKNDGRSKAIAQIQALMVEHGLTASDISTGGRKSVASHQSGAPRKPVAAKYKDSNGNSWSGRGLRPKWLTSALAEGKTLEEFLIKRLADASWEAGSSVKNNLR